LFLVKNNTPLHKAAQFGYISIIQLLIENGADVNASNNEGETALHYAMKNNNAELEEYLRNQGAFIQNKKCRVYLKFFIIK